LGAIGLVNVNAGIVPGMDGEEILLGMSALRQLDFSQRGGELILRQYR
jgi:aspartyl protease family protein